ncbi:hypothetical protein MTR67_052048 [Solanum verrucosum]|uniref:Uncharacterized protein n=1 Tax=Solanum verrucosum TaxID=315347 RepID=A0AAF0V8K6_SOLVR|nr:hypothetical protein MTR67_052048 [Solanum verrucosum]
MKVSTGGLERISQKLHTLCARYSRRSLSLSLMMHVREHFGN